MRVKDIAEKFQSLFRDADSVRRGVEVDGLQERIVQLFAMESGDVQHVLFQLLTAPVWMWGYPAEYLTKLFPADHSVARLIDDIIDCLKELNVTMTRHRSVEAQCVDMTLRLREKEAAGDVSPWWIAYNMAIVISSEDNKNGVPDMVGVRMALFAERAYFFSEPREKTTQSVAKAVADLLKKESSVVDSDATIGRVATSASTSVPAPAPATAKSYVPGETTKIVMMVEELKKKNAVAKAVKGLDALSEHIEKINSSPAVASAATVPEIAYSVEDARAVCADVDGGDLVIALTGGRIKAPQFLQAVNYVLAARREGADSTVGRICRDRRKSDKNFGEFLDMAKITFRVKSLTGGETRDDHYEIDLQVPGVGEPIEEVPLDMADAINSDLWTQKKLRPSVFHRLATRIGIL